MPIRVGSLARPDKKLHQRLSRRVVLNLNNSSAHSYGDRLGSVRGAQLFHYVLDVGLHRLFGDEELFSNITVAISASELTKNLDLARGERFVAVMFRQTGCDLGRDPFFAPMDLANYVPQRTGRHTLQDVSASAGLERPLNLHVTLKSRQNNQTSFTEFRPYGDHCIDAAHVRKPEVHDSDIGLMFTETLNCFASAAGLRHHLHVRLAIDDCGNPLTYERMVVDTQNTDLIGHNSALMSLGSLRYIHFRSLLRNDDSSCPSQYRPTHRFRPLCRPRACSICGTAHRYSRLAPAFPEDPSGSSVQIARLSDLSRSRRHEPIHAFGCEDTQLQPRCLTPRNAATR